MKLAYRELGVGPSLIILHGLFGQSDNWNTLAKQFSEKGFRVFCIDQRNHGLSPHSSDWNFKVMADDLYEFILEHNLINPIIMGHSMGGKTAMFFELAHPGLASKIIIVDIAARFYKPSHQQVIKGLNAIDFEKIKNRKEAELIMNEFIKDYGTKQFLLKNLYWIDSLNNKLAWRFNLKVITHKYELIGAAVPNFISEISTLIIKGELSDYISQSDSEQYFIRFPKHKLITIKGAGHWVHAEKPKEFFDCVSDFITN